MDEEIDNFLSKEERNRAKDAEIDRILSSFKLDAYSILELQPGCSTSDIKNVYRKKSLLIHPDKTPNPRAPDAFAVLKKAEATLQDDKEREALDAAFADARRILLREKKWSVNDERVTGEEFLKEWRAKVKEVLIDSELRRRRALKRQMEEEGRAKRQEEEEIAKRQKLREEAKQWEDTRDARVEKWRNYQKKLQKKKKKSSSVLA